MKWRCGGAGIAGVARQGDFLAFTDLLADLHLNAILSQVDVHGIGAVVVLDYDEIGLVLHVPR